VTPTPTPTVTPTPSQYYSFDVQSDPIGWVDPSGIFTVTANSNQTIRMKPSAGAMIKNLTVNGVEVSPKPESNYTIENVDRDYTIRLNNEPLPGVIIAAFDAASDDGYSVTFTDASFGSPKAWTWDFGDGTTATGNQVMHTYTKDGVYRVILWVRSDLAQSQVVGEIHIPLQIDQGSSLFFKS
jgi:PKD repeat protein